MEHILREVKKLIPFKNTTDIGDIVLVMAEDPPESLFYAFISDIERDTSRKDEWWHVSMQILSLPIQRVTWTLRTPQFTGQETFTLGGTTHFIQAVQLQGKAPKPSPPSLKQGGLRRVK
jgi:hypothetical protein